VVLPLNEQVVRAVLFDTGARRAELCRAKVGDLTEINGEWSLGITVKGRGTRRRMVHMPLDPLTVTLVRGFLADRGIPSDNAKRDAEQSLLVNRRGQPYNGSSFQYLITSIGDQAGIDRFRLSPHKVRHTVNVIRAHGGVDEFYRARLLGQSSSKSQERYRHVVQGGLREAKVQQADGLRLYLHRKDVTASTNGDRQFTGPQNP
jgi:integrase